MGEKNDKRTVIHYHWNFGHYYFNISVLFAWLQETAKAPGWADAVY